MVSVPYTTQSVSLFTEPIEIDLATTTPGAEIRYTLDGSEPDSLSPLYTAPVRVDRSLVLCAKAFKPGAAPSRTPDAPGREGLVPPPCGRFGLAAGRALHLL